MTRKRHLPDNKRTPTKPMAPEHLDKEIPAALRRIVDAIVMSPSVVRTALEILAAREAAKYTLEPIVERRTPRKQQDFGGKKKCDLCGARVRGSIENHKKGDFHQRAVTRGEGQ